MLGRSEDTTKIYENEPAYVKMYLRDVVYLNDMPQSYSGILGQLFRYCTPAEAIDNAGDETAGGMIIYLNGEIKKQICKTLKMLGKNNIQQLNNAINKLVKGKVLLHLGRSTYRPNPIFFGRGKWADISELRLNVNYNEIAGRTFQSVIQYKEQPKPEISAEEANRLDRADIMGKSSEEDELDPVEQLEQLPPNARATGIVEDEPSEEPSHTPQDAAGEPERLCTVCGKPMTLKNGRNGDFWGCTGYPACKHTENAG